MGSRGWHHMRPSWCLRSGNPQRCPTILCHPSGRLLRSPGRQAAQLVRSLTLVLPTPCTPLTCKQLVYKSTHQNVHMYRKWRRSKFRLLMETKNLQIHSKKYCEMQKYMLIASSSCAYNSGLYIASFNHGFNFFLQLCLP